MRASPLSLLLTSLVWGITSIARADLAPGVNVVAAWTRPPGTYSDIENPGRGKVVALDVYRQKAKIRQKRMVDVQYGKSVYVKGLPLASLVRAYARVSQSDGVLLHFENGMIVPMHLADLDTLDAFLATEICDEHGKNCEVAFPSAPRLDVYAIDEDPIPTTFTWNHLVVAKPFNPVARSVDTEGFSPWRHVDSLAGLEFVDLAAYRAQFAVGSSGGESVFLQRCQFCHSARHVGASYGWDFVSPLALYEKRNPANLLNHVKYPKAMAQRLGLRMPPQKDIQADETRLLWLWMRDVAKRSLRSYHP